MQHPRVAENRKARGAPVAPRAPVHRTERTVSFQAICGASRGVVGSKRETHLQLCCRALKDLRKPQKVVWKEPVAESKAERSRTRWMRTVRPLTSSVRLNAKLILSATSKLLQREAFQQPEIEPVERSLRCRSQGWSRPDHPPPLGSQQPFQRSAVAAPLGQAPCVGGRIGRPVRESVCFRTGLFRCPRAHPSAQVGRATVGLRLSYSHC